MLPWGYTVFFFGSSLWPDADAEAVVDPFIDALR
jgi:hypothetical protein